MKLELKPKHKQIIDKLLNQYVADSSVWAYGSRVQNKATEGSDLDLVVINANNPAQVCASLPQLRHALSESNIPISVDVVDWARIPESFQKEITRMHIVLK